MNAVEIAASLDFGSASARKTGRNPKFPYVPVVILPQGQESQVRGLAYETREEAVSAAQGNIDANRARIARQLVEPRYRALRREYGTPDEFVQ